MKSIEKLNDLRKKQNVTYVVEVIEVLRDSGFNLTFTDIEYIEQDSEEIFEVLEDYVVKSVANERTGQTVELYNINGYKFATDKESYIHEHTAFDDLVEDLKD